MIQKLAEWYKILNIAGLTSDTLTHRSNAIKKIAKGKTFEWILDCIRLYLNKPLKNANFKTDLTKSFTEVDGMFNQTNNDYELRVLAGAILFETIENNKLKNRVELAIALQSALFGISASELINIDILKFANDFLNSEAIMIRDAVTKYEPINFSIQINMPDASPTTISTHLTDVNKQFTAIAKSIDSTNKKIQVLEEESNIHWWIFKGFSHRLKKPFSEMEVIEASIILGYELSDLTTLLPPANNFENFLNKMLKDNFNEKVDLITFKDVVNTTDKASKEGHLKDIASKFGNICPLAHATDQSLLSDDISAWPSVFEKSAAIKSEFSISKEILAKQSYLENILLKALADV